MTKTLTTFVLNRSPNYTRPVMMPLGTTVEGSFVCIFGFGSLGFIWDLVFGAWDLGFNCLI